MDDAVSCHVEHDHCQKEMPEQTQQVEASLADFPGGIVWQFCSTHCEGDLKGSKLVMIWDLLPTACCPLPTTHYDCLLLFGCCEGDLLAEFPWIIWQFAPPIQMCSSPRQPSRALGRHILAMPVSNSC